jgi:hypothetical protein
MAWEWVAPVCTAAVGAIGVVATALTAKGGRTHAERVAGRRMEHERELAEDSRRQERLADAYVELLGIVNRTAHYADMVRPFVDTNPPAPTPPLPHVDEQMRAESLVMAFGSRNVEALFETWRQTIWAIIRADQEIGFGLTREESGRTNHMEVWRQLVDELKPAQKAARSALADAVAVELRSRPAIEAPAGAPAQK